MATVAQIKTEKQFKSQRWTNYDILSYGQTNDFPQAVNEIITASKTGSMCLDVYRDFVNGMGFAHEGTGSIVVNSEGQRLSDIDVIVTDDLTQYNGFALHFNYNQNYKITSIECVPFDSVRLCIPKDGKVDKVALHPDWGWRDNTRTTWSKLDIDYIHVFNPDPEEIEKQVLESGGWDEYKGQVLYVSAGTRGKMQYPLPKYIASITDMRTEQGLSNVSSRNVCANFLSAGIMVDIIEGGDQTEEQIQEKQRQLDEFQGDEATSQLWYMTAKSLDEVPQFVPFRGQNYDKEFSQTQSVVPENIGQSFKQPPILRAKDVGANFGADLMTNAYKYYNSITVRERQLKQKVYELVFGYWWVALDSTDFYIQPLSYNAGASIYERLGETAMNLVISILTNESLSHIQKQNALKIGLSLSDDEIMKLLADDPNA